MSIDFEKISETFEYQHSTELLDRYSAEMEKLIELCRTVGTPYPVLIWWRNVERVLNTTIQTQFIETAREPVETRGEWEECTLELILVMSAVEKKMYCELEELFDHEYIAEYEKKCEQDTQQRIEEHLSTVCRNLDDIWDAIGHIRTK